MWAVRVRSRHFNGRQPSGIGKYKNSHYFDYGMSLLRGGAYVRDENTSVRVCAKNAGGLMREGGVYLRDTTVLHIPQNHTGQAHRISVHTKEKRTQASSPLSNLSI